jgi:hypothetical protein
LRVRKLGVLVDRATRALGDLSVGERHNVILAAMVAMFLAEDVGLSSMSAPTSRALLDKAGWPTQVFLAVLRAQRHRTTA